MLYAERGYATEGTLKTRDCKTQDLKSMESVTKHKCSNNVKARMCLSKWAVVCHVGTGASVRRAPTRLNVRVVVVPSAAKTFRHCVGKLQDLNNVLIYCATVCFVYVLCAVIDNFFKHKWTYCVCNFLLAYVWLVCSLFISTLSFSQHCFNMTECILRCHLLCLLCFVYVLCALIDNYFFVVKGHIVFVFFCSLTFDLVRSLCRNKLNFCFTALVTSVFHS